MQTVTTIGFDIAKSGFLKWTPEIGPNVKV